MKLGENLAAGNYVLQIAARTADPRRKGTAREAVQRVAFEVR
jgi:hypothetical protein